MLNTIADGHFGGNKNSFVGQMPDQFSLFHNLDAGFAFHKIITNDNNEPIDYVFLDVNPAFEKITGLKKEDLIGKTVLQVLPQTEKVWIENYGKVALQGAVMNFEEYTKSFDQYFNVSAYSPAKNYFAVVFNDITKLKRNEKLLNRQNEEFRELNHDLEESVEHIKQINSLLEQNERKLSALYAASKTVLEFEEFNITARKLFNICKEITGAKSGYVALLSETGDENKVLFLDSGGLKCTVDESLPMPVRGLRGDAYRLQKTVFHNDFMNSEWIKFMPGGHVELKNVMFAPLINNKKAVGLIGLANKPSDFTEDDVVIISSIAEMCSVSLINSRSRDELIAAKENAEGAQETFTTIFNNAPVVMMLLDKNTEIVQLNATGLSSTGMTMDEVIGLRGGDIFKCIGTLNNPDGCGFGELCKKCKIRNTVAETLKTGKSSFKIEAELVIAENSKENKRTVLVSSSIIKFSKNDFVLVTIDDITDRKKMENEILVAKEKAEESDRLKTAFLANMSHEIRTPLNGILGFTELITRKKNITDDQKNQYARIIKKSSESLMQIINDILDISRMELGELRINNQTVNINEIFDNIYSIFKRKIKETDNKTPEFRCIKPKSEIFIDTDENRLQQIFINLLDNALKFTPKGSITFGIDNIKDGRIYFYVSDTGIGIPANKQSIIFDRFRQGEDTTNRIYGGNGLGLSIVKNLVELMGGEITVQSTLKKGTAFNFYLPYNITEIPKNNSNIDQAETTLNTNLKVLLVEDDDPSSYYMQEIFNETNYNLAIVKNGKSCLKKVKESKFDVILMDIGLPDMNGLDVVKEIRKFNKDIYIIAQTAYAMSNDKERALDAGCNDFIPKPIKESVLFGKLADI